MICAHHFTRQKFVKPYLCVTKWRRTVCLSRESALHVCLYFSTQKFLCLKSWCSVAIRFFATSSLVCSSRFTPWLTRTLTREKIDILGTPCLLYWFFFEFLLKERFIIKNKLFTKMIFYDYLKANYVLKTKTEMSWVCLYVCLFVEMQKISNVRYP